MVLVFLLLLSSLPAIAVLLWFRLARYPFSPARFAISLLAGATAIFPVLLVYTIEKELVQSLIPFAGIWSIFARALTEELSRLLLLAILFFGFLRFGSAGNPGQPASGAEISSAAMMSASGLVAGLGFAIVESAVYGASIPGNALLRVFTATPLHGACGFRVGSSVAMFSERPGWAIARFLSAVLIHGAYNLMLVLPGRLPAASALCIALSALAGAVQAIRIAMKGDEG